MEQDERMLTEEERKLVENNHDLIYMLADCLELDIDEYYGLLAISLCHAAQKYKTRNYAYGFAEFAKIIMVRELCSYQYERVIKTMQLINIYTKRKTYNDY